MSVASLGTTISAALNQAQSLLQGHHAHKTAQSGGRTCSRRSPHN